jgi:hypothetical protein
MYNKEKQLEKCIDADFCHNQITYLVVWPYCDMADNILPYFARHSLILGQAFPGIRLKYDLYYSIRSQERLLGDYILLVVQTFYSFYWFDRVSKLANIFGILSLYE